MSTTPHPPSSSTILGGKYRLVQPIGSGGMGTVFEAAHVELGTLFAIKMLSTQACHEASAVARFHREARLASSVCHDNICQVLDYAVSEDGIPYLVMPLLRGDSLSSILAQRPLQASRLFDIARQTLEALCAAHERRIVHRDLKPANIFITQVGDRRDFVKLLDFGVSKHQGGARDSQPPLTETGAVPGTPSYMAPEQARGLDDCDHRVDIYAMGVVLYEAVTGRRPFEGSSYNNILFRIASDPFPAPRSLTPEVPPELEQVILDAMARDPSERFASARAMREALDKVAALPGMDELKFHGRGDRVDAAASSASSQTAATLPQTPASSRYPAQVARRGLSFGLAAGAALALAALIGGWLYAGRPTQPYGEAQRCPEWALSLRRATATVRDVRFPPLPLPTWQRPRAGVSPLGRTEQTSADKSVTPPRDGFVNGDNGASIVPTWGQRRHDASRP